MRAQRRTRRDLDAVLVADVLQHGDVVTILQQGSKPRHQQPHLLHVHPELLESGLPQQTNERQETPAGTAVVQFLRAADAETVIFQRQRDFLVQGEAVDERDLDFLRVTWRGGGGEKGS